MSDPRGNNARLPLADLLRQSVYSRLAGYEVVNDAERLAQDPTFRLIGSEKIWERGAALTSRLQSFETDLLTREENVTGLAEINRGLIAKAESIESRQRVVLDMDSTEIPVHGEQEQSSYNKHFESTCYHPLLLFNGQGDCLAAKLRPGNVQGADDWEELLLQEIERQQRMGKEVAFRADAAELPSVPIQRSAAMAEPDRIQPWELVAALGAAQRNRKLVAHQLATAIGENRRSTGQARPILLAAAGRESSDATVVWSHATTDRGVASSVGIAHAAAAQKVIPIFHRNGAVSEQTGSGSLGNGFSGIGKGWSGADGLLGGRIGVGRAQVGVYFHRQEAKKEIPDWRSKAIEGSVSQTSGLEACVPK